MCAKKIIVCVLHNNFNKFKIMNAPKSLQCLSGRCKTLIHRFNISSRSYSVLKREKYKSSINLMPRSSVQNPVAYPHPSLVQLYSQTPSVEPIPSSISSHEPIKFPDVSFDEPVAHEDLIKALQNCKSVAEQMETLGSTLALSEDDIQKRRDFCKMIEKLLTPFFSNFKIQMFGSTVNHFGFKGCDIDMTFETFSELKQNAYYLEAPDVPLISEVVSGKVSPQELCELPEKEQLVFIHTVFLEYYKESESTPIFINAHVPLVRFYHDKYKLKCDLTFKNRVAYANTKLLYLFAKLDERVVPMMMTLRYWAKYVEIIGKGLMFNTYTITLLVIHFLQTRNPPILPSAQHIMSFSDSFESDDMDDKSFLDIKDKIPPSKNTQTLEELLREFFFYYLYFDFTRVICPMIAYSVPRDEFFADEKNYKFRMNSVCVQDPMCLSHNVAELVDYKICKKLFHELMAACIMFQENLSKPSSEDWGLLAILKKPEESLANKIIAQKLISMEIPLSSSIDGKIIPEPDRALTSSKIILDLLQNVLLFQCRSLELKNIQDLLKKLDDQVARQKQILQSSDLYMHSLNKRKLKKSNKTSIFKTDEPEETMLEQFQKLNTDHELILSAECKVMKNSWLGREFANVNPTSSMNILEKERLISIATADQNKQNVTDNIKPFLFLFECYISRNNPQNSLLINFRPLQRMSFNPILGIFLKEYIPKIVQNMNDSV